MEGNSLSVRYNKRGDLGEIKVDEFIANLKEEIAEKRV